MTAIMIMTEDCWNHFEQMNDKNSDNQSEFRAFKVA